MLLERILSNKYRDSFLYTEYTNIFNTENKEAPYALDGHRNPYLLPKKDTTAAYTCPPRDSVLDAQMKPEPQESRIMI